MSPKNTDKDYFSKQAESYSQYRPGYPPALFEYLNRLAPDHQLAWDCATGSGQAAVSLSEDFERVIATDMSAEQISHAMQRPNIEYRIHPAEETGFADASVSLITVATAIHWFDLPAFYTEVFRVAKPGAVLAAWAYSQPVVNEAVDREMRRFYFDVVGSYWPPGREHVDEEYRDLLFTFPELEAPRFTTLTDWTLEKLVGYVKTWSALNRYIAQEGHNPLDEFEPQLRAAWGDPSQSKSVAFPIFMRVGRVKPL